MLFINKVICKTNNLRMMSSSSNRIGLPKRLPINKFQKSTELLKEEEDRAYRAATFLNNSPGIFHIYYYYHHEYYYYHHHHNHEYYHHHFILLLSS